MNMRQSMPIWIWHTSRVLLAAAVLATLGLLAATLAGVADPRPSGLLAVDDRFADPSAWQISSDSGARFDLLTSGAQYQVAVRAGAGQVTGTAPVTVTPPCTIELSAAQVNGAKDAGYGLWWGDANRRAVYLVGVNSDGYLAILPGGSQPQAPLRDSEMFPRLSSLGVPNRLRVDVGAGQVVVRLNDEVGGQFQLAAPQHIASGFFVRASSHGDATMRFLSFKVWGGIVSRR